MINKTKVKGLSEIGLTIVIFFMLVGVIFPMTLCMQELAFFKMIQEDIIVTIEKASYDALLNLRFDALTKGVIDNNSLLITQVKESITQAFPKKHRLTLLEVEYGEKDGHKGCHIVCEYDYMPQFIFQGIFVKEMKADVWYEFPIDN